MSLSHQSVRFISVCVSSPVSDLCGNPRVIICFDEERDCVSALPHIVLLLDGVSAL